MTREQPTPAQIDLLEALVVTGSLKQSALRLGISYSTAKNQLSLMHRRTGLRTSQAIATGIVEGWLAVDEPAGR